MKALGQIGLAHVAVEEPCPPWHREAVERAAAIHGVGVDDQGLRVDALTSTPATGVLVTPAPVSAGCHDVADAPHRDVLNHRVTTTMIEPPVLSRFVDTGRLDGHLRRTRGAYRRRREQLLEVLAEARALSLRGLAAGLHATAQVASLDAEAAVARTAAASGIAPSA